MDRTKPELARGAENKEAHEGEKKNWGAAPLCPILMRHDEAQRPGPQTEVEGVARGNKHAFRLRAAVGLLRLETL